MPLCKECGLEFSEKPKQTGRQDFCSPKCRLKNWQKHNPEKCKQYQNKYLEKKRREYPKYCIVCGELLGFHKSLCCGKSECKNALSKRNLKKYRQERRLKVFDLLGGPVCVNCGCDDVRALEINHKKGGGCKDYKDYKSAGTRLIDSIFFGHRNLEDFEVTCRVCNALHYMKLKGLTGWKVSWKCKHYDVEEIKENGDVD